ncbi:unnamed protein product [Toxocara canis]|uniref:Spermatogenesis-associated protein 6 n=1 Tax=Toxocara canis TaxID=6265 RepID=A0A183VFN4_TOXCA|nr:unnamed protein product [Toxocara canis]
MAKSITDPERIDEYRRQKQMELKAMKRREEEAMRYHQKQELELLTTPQQMRVFETRPISVMSESVDSRDFLFSPSVSTWKRTYIVDATQPVAKNEILTSEELLEKERFDVDLLKNFPTFLFRCRISLISVDATQPVAKNEILTSEELLEKERFDVDLLKRREAFIEKPQPKPEIFRTGKRWQPPPEQPYIWPTMRRPLSVQPGCEPVIDFAPGVPKYLDEVEYRWEPYVYSPGYKLERKNFTPTNSPPLSPIRGMGTGPLDEVAKRQTRYLITPSPDGSHRPKPAFGGPRATPSGGFYPHAPNAIKIVKKKLLHAARTPSPSVGEGDVDDVEVIHERNYHLLGDSASPSRSPERISRAHNERIAPSSSHRSTHYTRGRQPSTLNRF